MEIIANDAEDYEAAIHYGLAGERRAREVSADCLRQIAEITGRPDIATSDERWLYVADLITHAWRRDDWLDLSEDQLARVFMMLDTYRRRLLKAAGWLGTKEDGRPLAYAYGTHYIRESDGTVGIRHVLTTVKPEASHA